MVPSLKRVASRQKLPLVNVDRFPPQVMEATAQRFRKSLCCTSLPRYPLHSKPCTLARLVFYGRTTSASAAPCTSRPYTLNSLPHPALSILRHERYTLTPEPSLPASPTTSSSHSLYLYTPLRLPPPLTPPPHLTSPASPPAGPGRVPSRGADHNHPPHQRLLRPAGHNSSPETNTSTGLW
jgi:hypothetical protein